MICFGPVHSPYSEEFKSFFKKHRDEFLKNPKYIGEFHIICNNFDMIINSKELKNKYENGNLELDDILGYLDRVTFSNQREGDEKLAKLASSTAGIKTDEKFEDVQKIFDIVRKRERTSIPPVYIKKNRFRGRMLSPNDILTMFAGNITDCCQKFGDVGMGAMLLGVVEENAGIFVVEEFDENGEPRIIGQSLVIRQKGKDGNNDRLTFDNIEITKNVKTKLSEEEKGEILEIYQDAGKQAIKLDKKFLSKLLKDGKITQEIHDSLIIKEVIAGRGYNDLELLDTLPEADTIVPDEGFYNYKTEHFGTMKPWIDSTKSGAPKGSNSYVPVLIATMSKTDLEEINSRNLLRQKTSKLSEVPLWYGKADEVQEYTSETIRQQQISKIKEIEKKVYREAQQLLNKGNVQNGKDINESYGLKESKIVIGSESNWYLIYGKNYGGVLKIQDLALEGGVNSNKNDNEEKQSISKLAIAEMADSVYGVMIKAAKEGTKIMCNSTQDTSLQNIKTMLRKGLAEIFDRNGKKIILGSEKELVYESGEKVEYRDFGSNSNIKMLDLEIRPDIEKMIEEKKRTENYLELERKRRRMEGREKEEDLDDKRREIRDDL